jgi:plastocyanin
MRKSIALLAVVALVVLGACSSKKENNTPSSPSASAGGGGGTTITMVDFKFQPATVTASASKALILVNSGSALHNFTIEGSSLDVDVQPGQTQTLPPPAPVQPGTYTFFCKYHRSQGMEGTITVTA